VVGTLALQLTSVMPFNVQKCPLTLSLEASPRLFLGGVVHVKGGGLICHLLVFLFFSFFFFSLFPKKL